MREIPLGKRGDKVTVVDDDDYDRVVAVGHWRAFRNQGNVTYAVAEVPHPDGGVNGRGYRRYTKVYMHKLITGYDQTDHRDRDGLNNQKSNLRRASHSQNVANSRKQSGRSSQYRGVSWHKGGRKWVAQIKVNKRRIYLGFFAGEEEAARAYDRAAREHFGEFAYLNFPD